MNIPKIAVAHADLYIINKIGEGMPPPTSGGAVRLTKYGVERVTKEGVMFYPWHVVQAIHFMAKEDGGGIRRHSHCAAQI